MAKPEKVTSQLPEVGEEGSVQAEIEKTEKEILAEKKRIEKEALKRIKEEKEKKKESELKKYVVKGTSVPVMVEAFMQEDFVDFLIMKNPTEGKSAVHEVAVNGMVFVFPKGKYFSAPMSIVNMLKEYFEVEGSSGDAYRVDRSSDNIAALS